MNKACGGHTGDFFSSQGQAGVCGGAGTQLPVLGAGPALLWLPDLRLQPSSPVCTCVEGSTVPSAVLQPPALVSTIAGFLRFRSCVL